MKDDSYFPIPDWLSKVKWGRFWETAESAQDSKRSKVPVLVRVAGLAKYFPGFPALFKEPRE